MHEMLPGISGARAEGQARFSGQLPALQPADHLRVRFGRPEHPKGIDERKTNQIDARSSAQGASQLARRAGHGPHTVSSVQPRLSNSTARRGAPANEKNSSS